MRIFKLLRIGLIPIACSDFNEGNSYGPALSCLGSLLFRTI